MKVSSIKVTELKPGDIVVYGPSTAMIDEQWSWDAYVGIRLRGYPGHVVCSKNDSWMAQR